MNTLNAGDPVIINDTVPNPMYHGMVGIYCGSWGGRPEQRIHRVRFPGPNGFLSCTQDFRRGELTTPSNTDDGA